MVIEMSCYECLEIVPEECREGNDYMLWCRFGKKFKKHSEKVFFSGVVMNQFYPEDNGMGIRIPKDKSLQVSWHRKFRVIVCYTGEE